jgi:ABC-type long-subunit fatty acid transport system fused permease/ATPase subunit
MTHSIFPSNYLFFLIATILAFLLLIVWVTKIKKITKSDKSEEEPPEKLKEGTHVVNQMDTYVVNQMDIVLGHIEVYGSICSNEAKALYGIKNLKAVIHKIRSKMKVEIVNIYHTGTKRFYGYGINK